jgi:hypothetical protein
VIGVRPAPTLDQYGLLASTACTFLRRLMFITQRTVVIGARPSPLFPLNGLLASKACIFSNMCVFTIVCSFRRPLVIRAFLAPSLHKNVLRASTACTFSKHLIFVFFCENAAFRRTVVIGARPSPKWASGLDGAHIIKHVCFYNCL